MLKNSETFCRCTVQILCGLLAFIVLCTFRDYGITWDEELQSQYGQSIVDYYFSGFKDQRYAEIFNLYLYGGMFDGFASLIDRFTPFSVYETRHLVNAGFGLLGLWGTWRLGSLMGGAAVGLMAFVFLMLAPSYYGHMFNNPKDIPFAAGVIWTLYFMARFYQRSAPENQGQGARTLLFKLAIVYGLTLGVRVGGIMLFAFWLAPMGLSSLLPLLHSRQHAVWRATIARLWRLGTRVALPVAILSYIVMLVCWPWAQQHPLSNPLRALHEFSNFPQDVEVLLDGTIYRSTQLPSTYVPLYFGIQLPEYLLLLVVSSLALLPWLARRMNAPQRQGLLLILLTVFVPTSYAVFRHPALYDAVRHFLFVLPLLCVLAALACRYVFLWAMNSFELKCSQQAIALGLSAFLTISLLTQIVVMVRLHPYEYIYANRLTDGVQGAYGKYELDYWGTSFKEAAEQIQAIVAKEGGIPSGKIYRIAICGPWDAAMIYLPPDYEAVVANEPAEFFLSTTRWMCQNMRPGKEIIRIERMGVPLSIVKDLRP